jgi:hypothetical protein
VYVRRTRTSLERAESTVYRGTTGDHSEFVAMWENFVPPLVRRSDRSAQKLEFYLQIYFSIFPLHPSNRNGPQPAKIGTSMRAFKEYLESDGALTLTRTLTRTRTEPEPNRNPNPNPNPNQARASR